MALSKQGFIEKKKSENVKVQQLSEEVSHIEAKAKCETADMTNGKTDLWNYVNYTLQQIDLAQILSYATTFT
jgi:hypothetical protein